MNIYDRQQSIDLELPESAAVVGCGGVGFWAGLFMAMSGAKSLYLFDPDVVEVSNLNRLPIREADIGKTKVVVLRELIVALRPEAVVQAMPVELRPKLLGVIKPKLVLDCTDKFRTQKALWKACAKLNIGYVRAGYDGTHITITKEVKAWDITENENEDYLVVPSWVVPAAVAGALGVFTALRESKFDFSGDLAEMGRRNGTPITKKRSRGTRA